MMRANATLIVTIGMVASALVPACASTPSARPSEVDPDRRDGVGAFTAVPRGFHTRSYWIEGPEGLVLIDTQFMPSETRRMIDTAERATGKRVVLAIVLHPNPDKFNGAEVLRARGVPVVTSAQVLARIPEVDAIRRRWFQARYAPDYPERTPELEAFGAATTTIEAAGLTLRAHVLGAGCSDAHVVIEHAGHVFVGDLVANGVHAWLELGRLVEWQERLREIAALRPLRVHPGRGESGGPELLDRQREYLERVRAIVRDARAATPATAATIETIRARIVEAYPGYGYDHFLRVGLPAVVAAVATEEVAARAAQARGVSPE